MKAVTRGILWGLCTSLLALMGCGGRRPPGKVAPPTVVYAPSPAATWPWPRAEVEKPHRGVTHWTHRPQPDGTVMDLFEFDFRSDPRMRLELYDQDEDDVKPFDDLADYWPHGVAWAAYHLNHI